MSDLMSLDWTRLIEKNKERTSRLFEFTQLKLSGPSRMYLEDEQINAKITSLPYPSEDEKSYKIVPVRVIDERPARGQEMPTRGRDKKEHRPWLNYLTVSGHEGWVTSVAVDPSNEFFATGGLDRAIKIWDLASGHLKLTLTGHVGGVRDVAISHRNPYMYSCCDAKQIFCWDLQRNVIVRNYHGHLSGVYCLAVHPTLDILVSGGRDSVARVWDARTRHEVFCLEGHDSTIFDVIVQQEQPNVVTASADATIRTWDLRNGKCSDVLTRHKKGVRALASHPKEWCFASASRDALFRWEGEESKLGAGFSEHKEIINALAINEDDVMVSVGDEGTIRFWDWGSGQCFQEMKTIAIPGSIESEHGIFGCSFDMTGTRLITCEADKTIKLWKEQTE